MQGISQGAWKECLWTGKAVMSVEMRGSDIRPPLVSEMEHPAMPFNLFASDHIEAVTKDCVSGYRKDRHNFHSKSISVLTKVNTIPPKPCVKDGKEPHKKSKILSSGKALDTFHPEALLADNIGSNEGLMQILRNMYDDFKKRPKSERRLQILVMDVNIYKRVVKVRPRSP